MIFTIQIFAQKKARLIKAALIMFMFGIFNAAHAVEANANPYERRLNDWATTLIRFVDHQGRTDFKALAKDMAQLNRFVEAIAKVSPASHPMLFPAKADRLAYHINAYNALAMKGVIDRGIPENLSSLWKRASFFRFRSVVIGGEKTNLYDYENNVIRSLGEPRVHFALNCMVVDCPRLPIKVMTAASVDSDLQTAAVEFFSKAKHIVISPNRKTVYLSEIMKFYTQDYVASGDKQDLLAYVNQYRNDAVPSDYRVKFLDYNWTINQAPEPQSSRERDLEFKSKITKIAA
jgi:hypothetical protein